MLHKRSAALILALTLPALAGCVQATRHSNTMVFGTNTTVGLKAGQNVNQVPEILIAYDRQEAVIMPLLANTSEKSGDDNLLSPCSLSEDEGESMLDAESEQTSTETENAVGDKDIIHPCKFVGIRKGKDNFLIQDSYSVLASFGARIEGNATSAEGAVGLAQYFATGAAAQTLAITGGASVVSVGRAAENSSNNLSGAANAAAALTGADPVASTTTTDAQKRGIEIAKSYEEFLPKWGAKIDTTPAAALASKLTEFEKQAGVPAGRLTSNCGSASACKTFVSNDLGLARLFFSNSEKFEAALVLW